MVPLLENARQEEFDTLASSHNAEVSHRQEHHFGMPQRLQHRHATCAMQVFLPFEFLVQSPAFLRGKPPGIPRPVLQQRENDDTQYDGWDSPENVNALPAFKTKQFRVMHGNAVDGLVGSILSSAFDILGLTI